MSNIGLILEQHEVIAKAVDEINLAIIVIKKSFLLSKDKSASPGFSLSGEELKNAREDLIRFLDLILPGKNGETLSSNPIVFKEWFKKFQNTGDFTSSSKALRTIRRDLTRGKDLDKTQFVLLDSLVTHLDLERSRLFNQIRKAHG